MGLYRTIYRLGGRERLTATLVFLGLFVFGALVVLAGLLTYAHVTLRQQVNAQIQSINEAGSTHLQTFRAMNGLNHLEPCSPEFLDGLRRIAFLPDGVNALLYGTADTIECSASHGQFETPIRLGAADMRYPDENLSVWLDRELSDLGLDGLYGSYVRRGSFYMVVPSAQYEGLVPSWLRYEVVTISPHGQWRSLEGSPGVYPAWRQNLSLPGYHPARLFSAMSCVPNNRACVVSEVRWPAFWQAVYVPIMFGLVLAALLGLAGTVAAWSRICDLWSLPTRIIRHFTPESIVCHYQPFLNLHSGTTGAVEVLVRWQDLDGKIIFPDALLPVIEDRNLTKRLTEMMVRKSFDELMSIDPALLGNKPLQVNFNIFPRDFDQSFLCRIFEPFLERKDRFEVVVELVETDELPVQSTRAVIEHLRAVGIRTYIDDFGVGYSSIHYLAELGADGVKLDRAFAMAPDGTLMFTMLASVIDMIGKTGLDLVVEGIESGQRLNMLKATNRVDAVQGYYYSRPVGLTALRHFLSETGSTPFEVNVRDTEKAGKVHKLRG